MQKGLLAPRAPVGVEIRLGFEPQEGWELNQLHCPRPMCCWHLRVSLHLEPAPPCTLGMWIPLQGWHWQPWAHTGTSPCLLKAADAEKSGRWMSPYHRLLLGIFLLFVKDNVIIIIPLKRKKKEIILKYI